MHSDPIADMLTRIRNAQAADHTSTVVPYSKIKEEVLKIMKGQKFISSYSVEGDTKKNLTVEFNDDARRLTLTRVSKPGRRIYIKVENIKAVRSGLGIQIISTPKGLMNNYEAKKQKLGGELICEVY